MNDKFKRFVPSRQVMVAEKLKKRINISIHRDIEGKMWLGIGCSGC